MGLTEYREKRDFRATPEPRGKRRRGGAKFPTFVVQKHAASHLHYDFRLEVDGVLKSWAVPKGPDLDPQVKRLAMQVEDHPLEYGNFEGTIPEGEYGGGTVMIWDRGNWAPLDDPREGLRKGRLKFVLNGEKLKGGWMLVRRGGQGQPDERHWFLFKERDEYAEPGSAITEDRPLSVVSGCDLEEIAKGSDRVWGPDGEVRRKKGAVAPQRKTATGARSRRGPAIKKTAKMKTKAARKSASPRKKTSSKMKKVSGKKPKSAGRKRTKSSGGRTKSRKPSRRARGSPVAASATRRLKPKKPKPDAGDAAGQRRRRPDLAKLLDHPQARRAKLPKTAAVQLATLVKQAPQGEQWLHEIKLDGYRMLCRISDGRARFISRNNQDWTDKFPELAVAAGRLPVDQALLDGEVVAMRPDGTTSFQTLQNIFQARRTRDLIYYAFDILHVNGFDVTGLPLEDRKQILKAIVPAKSQGSIRYSDHISGQGPEFFAEACQLDLEGIVSKRRDRPYKAGRGFDWLKVKCAQRAEFVIGGFTPPSGGRTHLGALLLGYYDKGRGLVYAGRVGTGFSDRTLKMLKEKLEPLRQPKSPFVNLSGTTGQARGVKWVRPMLVAEVEFSNWTDEGLLRHPSFQGLREDKAASEVVRDVPVSVAAAEAAGRDAETKSSKAMTKKTSRSTQTSRRGNSDAYIAGVRVSHPDRVLYPDDGYTKRDLAHYYEQVAEWILPHAADRPLALVRCPAGSGKPCFFQKHPGEGAPRELGQINVSETDAAEYHVAIHDLPGLIALVQMGTLEIHVWGSRVKNLEKPDRLIFDLDPDPSVPWARVVTAAREVRLVLEELGLASFLKTTGGKGLHIVVPVQARTSWDEAKDFCHAIADFIVRAAPDRYVATMSKAARKGKIFIDYLRNGRGATSVAPYSTRAKPGATVSVPISWEELSSQLTSDHFTIKNLPARLSRLKADPWAEMAKTRQSITRKMIRRLKELK